MAINHQYIPASTEKAGALTLEAIGILLAGMGLLFLVLRSDSHAHALLIAETVVAVGLPAILIYAGYWLGSRDLSSSEQWTVTRWAISGIVAATFFGHWILLRQGTIGGMIAEPIFFLLSCSAVGGVGGLVAGIMAIRSRSVHPSHRRDAASNEARKQVPTTDESEQQTEPGRAFDRLSDSVIADLGDILSDRRRLRIIEYLRDAEGATVTFDDVVDHLVETENPRSRHQRQHIAISVHHHHLPRMAASNIITYADDTKRIRYTPSQFTGGRTTGNNTTEG